jgi:hypothetical protein
VQAKGISNIFNKIITEQFPKLKKNWDFDYLNIEGCKREKTNNI